MSCDIPEEIASRTPPKFYIITGGASESILSGMFYHCSYGFLVISQSVDASTHTYIPHLDERIVTARNHMRLGLLSNDRADCMGMTY